jgi:hypothetical protein
MKRVLTIIVAVVAIATAGCGGGSDDNNSNNATTTTTNTGGVNQSDPQAVAKAVAESFQRCGDEGAGLRAQLVYPADVQQDLREDAQAEEAPGGCHPRPIKEVTTALVASQDPGVGTVVEVSGDACDVSQVPMIQVNGLWYVNGREIRIGLICTSNA